MALKSPLMPSSNTNLMSAFSPYTDSPTSPQPFRSPVTSNRCARLFSITILDVDQLSRSSDNSSSHFLHPNQMSPVASTPSDIPDPSPITSSSNGTDGTDIDETAVETEDSESTPSLRPSDSDLKVGPS